MKPQIIYRVSHAPISLFYFQAKSKYALWQNMSVLVFKIHMRPRGADDNIIIATNRTGTAILAMNNEYQLFHVLVKIGLDFLNGIRNSNFQKKDLAKNFEELTFSDISSFRRKDPE